MGAYLSSPVVTKECSTDENEMFTVASASMQGWRVSQEDAHNAILNYDDHSSLFAVYDGHGGHEVAEYTAQKLPNFIRTRMEYKKGNIEKALVDAFVEFDKSLVEREVVIDLKRIAGKEPMEDEHDPEEVDNLYQEATMPIEDVMAKYGGSESESPEATPAADGAASSTSSAAAAENPALASLKQKASKPISPFLRAKATPSIANGSGEVKKPELDFDTEQKNGEVKEEEVKKEEVKKEEVKKEEVKKEEAATIVNGDKEEKKTNGHGNMVNGKNGDVKEEEVAASKEPPVSSSAKGKGKGKGKGKSSLVKPKTKEEEDEEEEEEVSTEAARPPKRPAKSAEELYHNMLSEEVVDEETSEDEEDATFGQGESDSDDDDDDEEEEEEIEEEEEDTDEDSEEEEAECDGEEYIGGDFNEEPGNDSGCTAVVALLVGRELFVANAGDSRCVVCRDGKAIEMSFDHKPEDEPERARIYKAGGRVTPDGRVNGGLNLSRAIGDHAYKTNKELPLTDQMISPEPDVRVLPIDPKTDSFIVLACDGIWNSLSSQEVVDFVNDRLKAGKEEEHKPEKLTAIIEELFEHCLAPDTMGDGTGCDNMTAVIAKFKPNAFGDDDKAAQGGVKRAAEVTCDDDKSGEKAATAVEEEQPPQKKVKVDQEESPQEKAKDD